MKRMPTWTETDQTHRLCEETEPGSGLYVCKAVPGRFFALVNEALLDVGPVEDMPQIVAFLKHIGSIESLIRSRVNDQIRKGAVNMVWARSVGLHYAALRSAVTYPTNVKEELSSRVCRGGSVTGEELVELARIYQAGIPPRVLGWIRRSVVRATREKITMVAHVNVCRNGREHVERLLRMVTGEHN